MTIENDKIATLKLVTGEEIIAKVTDHTKEKITIHKPLVIMMSQQGLAFGTFVPTMDQSKGIEIDINNVVVIGYANEKVVNEYNNATSTIKTPPKSNIVV